MHPVLFEVFGHQVYTYGAAFASSIVLVIILSIRRLRKEGLNEDVFLNTIVVAMIGLIGGSKLLHIIVTFGWYIEDPMRFLDFRTGHVFYGGYIGSVLFPYIYVRYFTRERFLPIVDLVMTYVPLGLGFHRSLGCFNAGCCHGEPTTMPWGVIFPPDAPAGLLYGHVAVHPTQLYEALLGVGMFFAMVLYRDHIRKIPGELLAMQVALYSAGRFVIEFFRGDPVRGVAGPLSTSQWISIALLAATGIAAFLLAKQRNKVGVKAKS
jgi:phosphatidylglycerol---prolipoprotein diacylglyceryl transferase